MPQAGTIGSSVANWQDATKLLLQFDQAWQKGTSPRIEAYLPPAPCSGATADPLRQKLLEELIKIDLEYCWRKRVQRIDSQTAGKSPVVCPLLEDYLERFPELGRREQLSLELIGWEYRVRQRWGDRPGQDEYGSRFPHAGSRLTQALDEIDAKLAQEFFQAAKLPSATDILKQELPKSAIPELPLSAVGRIIDGLRSSRVLGLAQLNELILAEQRGGFPDARALGKEILQRGWLTPFQVNQVLLGRGKELLLGSYVLLERLGEGATGLVFKAWQPRMRRLVALKVIRKELVADPEVVQRFRREIQVASRLSHPNVVRAYDSGVIGDSHYLAMEYVEGMDLGRMVKQCGRLPVLQACEYIRQAALGLQYAHESGLVHRDIKPQNLFMSTREGLIKLMDLGLARLQRDSRNDATALLPGTNVAATLTTAQMLVMGTPDYMAPEQALDFHGTDIRADIYSLGCTLFFLLTGQPPFQGSTLAEKLLRHQQAEAPSVGEHRSDAPAELDGVLATMLAKRPEDRYQTPGELAAALAPVIAAKQGRMARWLRLQPGGWAAKTARRWSAVKGRRRWLLLSGAFLLCGLALVICFLFPGKQPSPLDHLDPNSIARDWLSPDLPKEPKLVAVLANKGLSYGNLDVNSIALSPEGRFLACNGLQQGLWDLARHEPKKVSDLPEITGLVRALAFSPDGGTLAAGGVDGKVQLWRRDGEALKPAKALKVDGKVSCLAFAPNGKTLVSGHEWGVCLWDIRNDSDRPRATIKSAAISWLSIAPDNKRVALTCNDDVRMLHLNESEPRKLHEPGLAVFVDGTTLAVGPMPGPDEKKNVLLWDLDRNEELAKLEGWTGPVSALACSPNGRSLAAAALATTSSQIILWDLGSRNKKWVWQVPKGILESYTGRGSRISSLAFAPDGRHLLVGCTTGFLLILRLR